LWYGPGVRALPNSTPVGRRQRKKLATREQIRLAALQLALQRGIEHVTVQDISDTADVALRTFFGYFPTKEAALVPEQLWTAARFAEALAARPSDEPPMRSLRAVMLAMAVQVTGHSETLRLWRELARRRRQLVEQFLGSEQERVQALAEAVALRTGQDPRSDLYPVVAAWMAWTGGSLAVHRWLHAVASTPSDIAPSIEGFVEEIFDLLERGLNST
jgi:AcrR family transcriptional regulator